MWPSCGTKTCEPACVKGPAPIAGLTGRVTLFCLEELARDVGMKVFFRVDHIVDKSGHVQHEATGPAPVAEATHALAAASGFGQAMAALACRCEVSGPWEHCRAKANGAILSRKQDCSGVVAYGLETNFVRNKILKNRGQQNGSSS